MPYKKLNYTKIALKQCKFCGKEYLVLLIKFTTQFCSAECKQKYTSKYQYDYLRKYRDSHCQKKTTIACRICGTVVPRLSNRQMYCSDCVRKKQNEIRKLAARIRARENDIKKIGDIVQCRSCGRTIEIKTGNQIFCLDCAGKQKYVHRHNRDIEYIERTSVRRSSAKLNCTNYDECLNVAAHNDEDDIRCTDCERFVLKNMASEVGIECSLNGGVFAYGAAGIPAICNW